MSVLENKHESYLKKSFGLNFRIGLVVALGLCIMAFKITVPAGEDLNNDPMAFNEEPISIETTPPRTKIDAPKPPEPQVLKTVTPPIIFNIVEATKPVDEVDDNLFLDDIPPEEDLKEAGVTLYVPPKEPVGWAEEMPKFTGGDLLGYLKQAPYCALAIEYDIEGQILASFVVDEKGQVTDVKIERSLFPCLDQAVINHIKNMPAWEPGKMQGRPVKVRMGAPIVFKLK